MLNTEKIKTSAEALNVVQSGNRVFVQGSAATPHHLLRALEARADELKNVELVNISMLGEIGITKPQYADSFYFNSLFVSAPVRKNINHGNGDYVPVFLSEIYQLFERNILPLDVALVHVSPPDKHGFCSLGLSVDITRAAVKNALYIIAQVNPQMPRTHGDGLLHIREINALVEVNEPLPEVHYDNEDTQVEHTIGKHCASLIEDRSTLQMGIGAIPDAVLDCLANHKDLGVHTEMFSDGVMNLVEKGVLTNRYKKKHKGKIATSFAIGSRNLYDYVDDNPQFVFLEASYVNDGNVIRANPRVAAINSALEIDITGQVCADSIGTFQYSGVGGQMDFMRGAALSEGGKPIIAMQSATKKGESKIVPVLKTGASVATSRAHMHYVVTEYGIANLFGKNLHQRAYELLRIAHPNHQEALERAIIERFGRKYVQV
ncbi:MAG: acetyl-CoA hydrolase/transferase C-terminal domain-containing protein [Chitinophagales bacterium]|nr:acetyl-CoA hydrolase/transferase C-terminal domain-containing protein [Chitinophagales bacterium]